MNARSTEIERLRMFSRIARAVAGEFDLAELVSIVTDAATEWSGGKFGAFFYNQVDDKGEIYSLYTLSGVPRSAFANFEMPRKTAVFAPTFDGTGVVRSDDIRKDPRYGLSGPHFGMPPGHLPVVSYLAVPVISRTGTVHGGIFIAHDEPGQFDEEAEEIVMAIAAHAAIAIDNAALLVEARRESEVRRIAHEASAKLAAIVAHSDDAIVSKSLDGTITSWNASAERLFGYTAGEAIGRPIIMLIPDDRLHEEDMIIGGVREGRRTDHFETQRRRKDGSLIHVALTVSPIRDEDGVIVGASKIARDISDRVQAQEQQALLMREMNHRIKNLFALTGGLISLSARSATSVEELTQKLRERLTALARAHALTISGEADGESASTDLVSLVRAILSPYEAEHHQALEVTGSNISIRGSALTALALVLHELATNAAKYGALSSPDGRLSVNLACEGDMLALVWIERGGPGIDSAPTQSGFGSKLEKATLGGLGATIDRQWEAEGLTLCLKVPFDRLTR
ncbi:PAS domain S-box-containing protein [Bosea sp. BE271]|uniref:sensor histidine kinase n=1 Tax=Bosea TaxID=85413 RepID=UPI00285A64E7|nr:MULTISPECIES: PAS domain S-box protein [Bosea]MDR6830978.1 PAS domain S-box-containing protein [Bosea robiniae]MDR6897353.1 PAS domain S-box-containing protein [Bosea sp. BE109]MDR7140750.1 PAS domain S-box-containing protein [Bosea sp. BE168]MDR7177842.1 PAS domain S-box-containing protein [Bosea sp. BE271]